MFLPIREISPYQRKWSIKARVTSKSTLREINTQTGRQTKVFSIDVLDADGGEIKCQFWGDCCDKFFNMLEEGKVYSFSEGNVKVANKRFNSLNHAYEVSFDRPDIAITPVDDNNEIDNIKFNFMTVKAIEKKAPNSSIDVCAVVKSFGPAGNVKTKNGGEVARRVLTIVDSSLHSIDVTVWAEHVGEDSKFEGQPTVAFKSCLVRDFGGRSMSLGGSGKMDFNCKEDIATRLSAWWSKDGVTTDFTALTNGRGTESNISAKSATVTEMRSEATEYTVRDPKYFKISGCYLASIRTKGRDGNPVPIYYDACPECNRKLFNAQCHNCNKAVTAMPRGLMLVSFVDRTDVIMCTVFNDQVQQVLEVPFERLVNLSKEGGDLQDELRSGYYSKYYNVTIKAHYSEYEGVGRVKHTAVKVEKASPKDSCNTLFKQLQAMDSTLAVC